MENKPYQKRRLEDDLLPNVLVKMPDATKGTCNRCHQVAELGDGFCLGCWDKGSIKDKVYSDTRNKPKRRRVKNKK